MGEVNWKQENMAFLSSRPGLGKPPRGCLSPSPTPQGRGVGGMALPPWSLWASPHEAPSLSADIGVRELHIQDVKCSPHQKECPPN